MTRRIFAPPEKRPPTELDPEAIGAKAKLLNVQREFELALEKDKYQKKSGFAKFIDRALSFRLGLILSSITTGGKLSAAAMTTILTTPALEAIGSVIRKIPYLSKIAEKAPREGGGFDIEAETKALKQLWSKDTRENAWDRAKGKLDKYEMNFGDKKQHYDPYPLFAIAGHLHGAIKTFPRDNEIARSIDLRSKYYVSKGLDITNPVMTRLK